MKYEITKLEDGRVSLKLGLHATVTFAPDCAAEDVVLGVSKLFEHMLGVSMVELVHGVLAALESVGVVTERPANDETIN